jgi:serine protease AprX
MNPYAVAPWVVSVGATDSNGKLAGFSSRGDFASALFHPTVVAPGVEVVSSRALGVANVTGVQGLLGADLQRLTLSELPYYTTASGTSFSAPQVAGTIALMLEANPSLNPAQVRDILQRTATPLPPYYQHEVGAGMLNTHAAVLQAAFPNRRLGSWRSTIDRRQVQFGNDPLTTFSGNVSPWTGFETTVQVPQDTLFASVQIGWGPLLSLNDLALYVYDSSGTLRGLSNSINLPILFGKVERVTLNLPSAGTWRIRVRNSLGILGTSQPIVGVVQFGRARYGPITDIGSLPQALRSDIYSDIRGFTMWPNGSRFRPNFTVSRLDLARVLSLGARVPQYAASQPLYSDVSDTSARLYVESVQSSPLGSPFTDTPIGGQFRPNDVTTRLVGVVALVRAAGLASEAGSQSGNSLPFLDAASIPSEFRGYVAVAVSKGLIPSESYFRPQNGLTRGDLARAIAAIQRRAVQ